MPANAVLNVIPTVTTKVVPDTAADPLISVHWLFDTVPLEGKLFHKEPLLLISQKFFAVAS
jgi:hypothetical protein